MYYNQVNRNFSLTINPRSFEYQEENFVFSRKPRMVSTLKVLEFKNNDRRRNNGLIHHEKSNENKPAMTGFHQESFVGLKTDELKEIKQLKSQISMFRLYIEGINSKIDADKQLSKSIS